MRDNAVQCAYTLPQASHAKSGIETGVAQKISPTLPKKRQHAKHTGSSMEDMP